MESINLLSLINAKNTLSASLFEVYLKNFGIEKLKENELDDLETLLNKMKKYSSDILLLNQFYVDYKINQISKEFDLLRFGKETIVNIELKSQNTKEKIIAQLRENRYYLSFLDKEVLNFTYVTKQNKLFFLNENDVLIETNLPFLISKLAEQNLMEIDDIDKLFNPSNYLISPFNSTEAFLEGRYFLTDHQRNIKKDVLKYFGKECNYFVTIEGSAGTGKTLLTYDIAKEYLSNSKKVIIFHCGTLNEGQNKLNTDYSWSIAPIKRFRSYELQNYDLIIIDEIQRIYKPQLDDLLNLIKNTNAKCIFSYDAKQCLSRREINRNIPKYLKENLSPKHFKLTEKIRTNKEISSFIKTLFDLSKANNSIKYKNINIQYFSNYNYSKDYMDTLSHQDWKVINYTPSLFNPFPYEKYQHATEDTAHTVIGQEFDNVVAVLDEHFYYKPDGTLSTQGWNLRPYYHPTKMLFQILTRTRKKLIIIVINNEIMLEQCLKILQSK